MTKRCARYHSLDNQDCIHPKQAGMLLITSMPARISRRDAAGRDIGRDYQRECIESWRCAGFQVLSINSVTEPVDTSICQTAFVKRDASSTTGRPHVFLSDMLAIAASEACGQPFALINADVFIADTGLHKRFINMRRGEVYLSRRIDIEGAPERGTKRPDPSQRAQLLYGPLWPQQPL